MLLKRKIDHIVYAVPNLEKAMEDFEELTGTSPIFGGYHTTQGTKNAVVNLGNQQYLELLAVDEKNTAIATPRWMGVDLLKTPQITRWSLKSTDLKYDSEVLQKYHPDMGKIQGGQRKMTNGQLLKWEMIMPLPHPIVELAPFLTDWKHSAAHPTDSMPEQCQLIGLELTHPTPEKVMPMLRDLGLDLTVLQTEEISIKMKMQTPKGIVQI